jgi:GDP-4-dehydro-6-deoxy-D-mannose reductase
MAQEAFALASFRRAGVRVICTRSFNHSGRGQSTDFVVPGLVRRVLAAMRSGSPTVTIGNTTVSRDFLHVEDVARAYVALVEQGITGEVYNVSSGLATPIGDVARIVADMAGANVQFVGDSNLQRTVDLPHLAGSNQRLRDDTGWTQSLTLADVIRDVIAAETA